MYAYFIDISHVV